MGFYNYRPGDRHRMDLNLVFAGGTVTGDGNDDVGRFLIKGKYDTASRESHWTKTYPGSHDVYYRGFREGKGIWGTWQIDVRAHGGFHIWPKGDAEGESDARAMETVGTVDAVGVQEHVGPPLAVPEHPAPKEG